mmetsp:Transcript_29051/g.48771  ORF Transcript_29051/g.48771 Transcript_29051/m.48771 type:complete len:214 (+) Transcript_29051:533-1174(+)
MGSPLSSAASDLASCAMPALLNPYAANFLVALPSEPAPFMLKTCPPPACARISVNAAREQISVPYTFVSMISFKISGVVSTRLSYEYPLLPALLIQMSTPPISAPAKSRSVSTSPESRTSHGTPHTRPSYDASRFAKTADTCSAEREVTQTWSPAARNASASARPMPFVLPVITTLYETNFFSLTSVSVTSVICACDTTFCHFLLVRPLLRSL